MKLRELFKCQQLIKACRHQLCYGSKAKQIDHNCAIKRTWTNLRVLQIAVIELWQGSNLHHITGVMLPLSLCVCVCVCVCVWLLQQSVCCAEYLLFMRKTVAPGPQRCPHSLIPTIQIQRRSVCVCVCVCACMRALGVGMPIHTHSSLHAQGLQTASFGRNVFSIWRFNAIKVIFPVLKLVSPTKVRTFWCSQPHR